MLEILLKGGNKCSKYTYISKNMVLAAVLDFPRPSGLSVLARLQTIEKDERLLL